MLTRLETTSGRLAVSAMNPAAMTNARVLAAEKPRATSMAITMGVRMSAAPSLAKTADTTAPSSTMKANRRRPLARPQRATCSAAHAKNPASSSSRLMMMTATKVAVAFQTMPQTTATSAQCTTPRASATMAPSDALQPMPRPAGCQMTRTRVAAKIRRAASMCCFLRGCAGGSGGRSGFGGGCRWRVSVAGVSGRLQSRARSRADCCSACLARDDGGRLTSRSRRCRMASRVWRNAACRPSSLPSACDGSA